MVIHHNRKPVTGIGANRKFVCQTSDIKNVRAFAREKMVNLKAGLITSGIKPFDNSVGRDDCVDRLIAHRVIKKFDILTNDKTLERAAFDTFVEYDYNLPTSIDLWSDLKLRQARQLLVKWFSDFSIRDAAQSFTVTPGETFTASRGEVSLHAKLFDKKHWTTTYNCVEDTCEFIYNCSAFKRAAKYHIGVVTRSEKRRLYSRFRQKPNIGYSIFAHLLKTRVLTVVDGARGSSVPKSNDERRFINVEAMFPVILQRAVAAEMLQVLKRRGNDLGNFAIKPVTDHLGIKKIEHSAQALHGLLIKSSEFATIDFSKASDSVTIAAVAALFPKSVSDLLFKYRSHYVKISEDLVETKKLSSMGNGFTFETMTCLLYAIGSAYTPFCRVYGDDVVIPNEFAEDFVRTCSRISFNVNEKKTFIKSFFRESCGYFYSDFHGYIISYDFNPIETMADVITTCNKLTCIIEAGQASDVLLARLTETRDQIAACVHASRKGPVPATRQLRMKFLSSYIFDVAFAKKQRRCKHLSALRQHYIKKNAKYFDDCQLQTGDVSLIYMSFFVPKASKHLFTSKDGMAALLPALYAGRRVKPTVRGKGKWVDLPAFVSPNGTTTLISNIINDKFINGCMSGVIAGDIQ